MEKKKKEVLLIILMLPVLGFVIYTNLLAPKKVAPPLVQEPEAAASPAAVTGGGAAKAAKGGPAELPALDAKVLQMQNSVAALPWGRDPFNPPPTPVLVIDKTSALELFKITGVIPGSLAIINGEPISIGEEYHGYRLSEVTPQEIKMEKDGQTHTIPIPEELR